MKVDDRGNGMRRLIAVGVWLVLYIAHTFPHQPLYASRAFKNGSGAGRFGDTVEEIDWRVGRIVETLRQRRIADNTLVIFTSDNGPWCEGSAGGLRGRKGQSLEGGGPGAVHRQVAGEDPGPCRVPGCRHQPRPLLHACWLSVRSTLHAWADVDWKCIPISKTVDNIGRPGGYLCTIIPLFELHTSPFKLQ